MSSLYQLETFIGPAFYKFEFTAEGDTEARALVASFAHVAQPFAYGPLNEIGNFKELGIQSRRDSPRRVPLEVVEGGASQEETEEWKPSKTKSVRAQSRRRR